MRVVHINGEKGFSGGEVQNFHLMEYLREAGDTNILIGRKGGRAAAEARSRGFEVHELPMRSSLDLRAISALRRLLKHLAPEVMHLHTSRAHVLAGWAAAGLPIPAKVVTRRMDYPLRRNPFSRFLYGRAVDRVVAISKAVRTEVLRLGVPEERIALIPSGVDVERFRPIREQTREQREAARELWGVESGTVVVGAAASLHPRKGQDLLLKAAVLLREREVPLRILIAGAGGWEGELRAMAEKLGVAETVSFLGHVTPTERLLRALDIFCMPSRKEGLGVAALEAMGAGLPVVACRAGGLVESVKDGETGRLVPVDDPEALAVALEDLARDPQRRAAMGERGALRVEGRYSAKAMAGSNRSLYLELLA